MFSASNAVFLLKPVGDLELLYCSVSEITCLQVQMLHKHCYTSNFIPKTLFLSREFCIITNKLVGCVPVQNSMVLSHLQISFGFPAETQIHVTMLLL